MWIHRVPFEAALFSQRRRPLQPNELAPPTAAPQVLQSTADVLPCVYPFTSSSPRSLYWVFVRDMEQMAGSRYRITNGSSAWNALIAQAMVLWDFCAVFSSWAGQLPSDAVASFFLFSFFSFCLRTHLTNVCRPAAGNNCFGRRPIVRFWTERAVPAGRVPDTSRHSPRLLI